MTAENGSGVGICDRAGFTGVVPPRVVNLNGQVLHGAAACNAAEESAVLSSNAHTKGDRMAVSVKDAGVALDRCPRGVLVARNILHQHGVQAAFTVLHPLAEGFQVFRAGDPTDLPGRRRAGSGLHGGIFADGVVLTGLGAVLCFLRCGTRLLRQCRCGQQRQAERQHKKQACDTFSHVCILLCIVVRFCLCPSDHSGQKSQGFQKGIIPWVPTG